MKDIRNIVAMAFVAVLAISCSNQETEKKFITVKINPNQETKFCKLSDLVEDAHLVSLETTSESLIGRAYILFIDEKSIIIQDNNRIMFFDPNGKFLNKIEALGNGPLEYNAIYSAYVDPVKRLVYIVDRTKVQAYDFGGAHVSSHPIDFFAAGLYKSNDGQFVVPVAQMYKTENRNVLKIMDSTFNVVDTLKSRNPYFSPDVQQGMLYLGSPYELNGKLLFKEPFVDTIFEVTNSEMTPAWAMDQGDLALSTHDGIVVSDENRALKEQFISSLSFRENTSFIFFSYYYGKKEYREVFDKRGGQFLFNNGLGWDVKDEVNGIENDIIPLAPKFWPAYTQDNIIADKIDPSTLSDEQMEAFHCQMGDNPILIIGTLK